MIAASLILLTLLAGIVGTSIGLARANNSAKAERRAKLDAVAKRQEAERNLAFAKKGNEILGSVFASLDPKANYATVAELRNALRDNLARTVKELEGSAIGDPLEVAAMQNTLGLSLLGLGEANLAIDVFGKALATRKELLGADHPDTLTAMGNLAQGYLADGKMDRALPLMEETLRLTTAKRGADHPDTLTALAAKTPAERVAIIDSVHRRARQFLTGRVGELFPGSSQAEKQREYLRRLLGHGTVADFEARG